MTAKEIYESIDLSQLPKESAEKLRKVEKATEGFTIESDKVNKFMNSVYKKIKENKPTALKNLKVEEKVTKTEVKKGDTTQVVEDLEYKVKGKKKVTKKTPTPSKPTKKSTFLGEVKKRKKKGEDWEVAKARVKKELDEERAQAKKDAEKVVSKTSQALKNLEKMLKDDPKLAGYPRTYGKQSKKIDAAKDAKIKAKPAGKRVSKKGHKNQYGESKGGRVYWENRDNRSDRYAPDFPNKVFLEVGGELDDLGFPMGHTYLVVEVSPSGDKKLIKKTTDYITALTSSAVARGMKSSKDARVVIVDMEEKRVIHEAFEAGGEITITPTQLINNPDALVGTTTMTELFECGGVTAYQEGGEVFVAEYPLTNAGSADYVAGSNTMSNMFEDGGEVNYSQDEMYDILSEAYSMAEDLKDESTSAYIEKIMDALDDGDTLPQDDFRDILDEISYTASMNNGDENDLTNYVEQFAKGGQVSLGMKKDLEFFEDIRVKTLNMEVKQGILLKYGFVEPEDAKKYEKESGYKFKEDKSIAGVIDVKNNKAVTQWIEDGDKYFFFFNTTQPDRVVIIDAFDGDKLSATREDNKRAYLGLKLFLLDLRLETSGRKMAKGGWVVYVDHEMKGKELLGTFHSKKAADKYKTDVEDDVLSTKGVAGIGTMSKSLWDKKEAPYLMAKGGFVAFYNGKRAEIDADTLFEAKKKAIQELKVPKSKQGLLSVMANQAMENEDFRFMAKGGKISSSELDKWDELLDNGADVVVYDKNGVKYVYQGSSFEKDGVAVMKGFDESTYRIMPINDVKSIEIGNIYAKGGRLGFEGLAKKVAKRYEGKPVKAKYQDEYGKTYSKEEALEVGRKVAAKVYGQQQANMKKMAKGGEVTFENDYYGFSARVPYMGKTYLVEMGKNWNAPFDEVVISDGFTRIDGGGAKNIYQAMLKAKQNAEMPKFAKGGSLMGHGLEVGDKIVQDLGSALKVSTKDGNIVYVDLASGYRDKDMPLPFAKGGAVSGMTIPEIAKKFDRTTADVFSQLQVGEAHEMEHTSDPKVARKIALDHLAEDLDYYTKLKKLGL